jgi:hypothetical protein
MTMYNTLNNINNNLSNTPRKVSDEKGIILIQFNIFNVITNIPSILIFIIN